MNKKVLGITAVGIAVAVALSILWSSRGVSESPKAQVFVDAVYSQSLDKVQTMSLSAMQQRAPAWVPQVSGYLQTNYGMAKEVKQTSAVTVATGGPLGEVLDSVWQVTAERGNYEMRTIEQTSSHKLSMVAFRFPPSSDWIVATTWPRPSAM
jgi:hypothetical protein